MYPKSYKVLQNTAFPITRKHCKDGSCEHKNEKYRENDTSSGITTPRGDTGYEDDCKESKPRVILQNYTVVRRENTFSGSPSHDWGSPTLGRSYIEAASRVDHKRFDLNAITETISHSIPLTQENCTSLQPEVELVGDTQIARARHDIPAGVELANHNLQDTRAHTKRTYAKDIADQAASSSSGGYIKHIKKSPNTSQSKPLTVCDVPPKSQLAADDVGLKSTNRREKESERVKSERALTDNVFSEDASESNNFQLNTNVKRENGSDRKRRRTRMTAPPNRPSSIASAERALSSYKEDVRNIASRLETFMGKSDTAPVISRWFDQLQLAESKNPFIQESDEGSEKSAKNGHLTQLVSTPRALDDVHGVAAEKKLCPLEDEAATVKQGGANDSSTKIKTPGQKRKINATSQKHPPFGQHHRNEESGGLARSKNEGEVKDGDRGRKKMVDTATTVTTQALDDENKNESRRRPNHLCSDGKRDTNTSTSTRNPVVPASTKKSGGSIDDDIGVTSQNEGIRGQTVARPAAAWVEPKEETMSQSQRQAVDAPRTHHHGKGDKSHRCYQNTVTYEDFEADVEPGNPLERRGSDEHISSLPVPIPEPGGDRQTAHRRRDANQPTTTTSALEEKEKNSHDSHDDSEIIARLISRVNELIRGDVTLPSSFVRDAQKEMSLYYPSAKSAGKVCIKKNVDPPEASNSQGHLSNRSKSSQGYLSRHANVSQDHTSNPAAKDSRHRVFSNRSKDSYEENPEVHLSGSSTNPNDAVPRSRSHGSSPIRKSRRSKSARRSNRHRKSKTKSPISETVVEYCEGKDKDKERRRKEARDASKFRSKELNRIVKRKRKHMEARDRQIAGTASSARGAQREKQVRPKIDSQRYVQAPKASLDPHYFTRPAIRAYGERIADRSVVHPLGTPEEYFKKRDNEFSPHGKGTIDDSSMDNTNECDALYDTYREHKSFYLSNMVGDRSAHGDDDDDDEIHCSVDVISPRRSIRPKRFVSSVNLDKQPKAEPVSSTVEGETEEMRNVIDLDEDDGNGDLVDLIDGPREEEEDEAMMPTVMPTTLADEDVEHEKVDTVVPTVLLDADMKQASKREKKVDRVVPTVLSDAETKQAKKKEKVETTIPSLLDTKEKQAKKKKKVGITVPSLLDVDRKQAKTKEKMEKEEEEGTLLESLLAAEIIERRKKEEQENTAEPTMLVIADIMRQRKREEKKKRKQSTVQSNAEEKERKTKTRVLSSAEEKERRRKPTMLSNADNEQPRKRKEKAKPMMHTFSNADTKQLRKEKKELDTTDLTFSNADTEQPRKKDRELDKKDPTFLNAEIKRPRKEDRELDTKDPTFLNAEINKMSKEDRDLDTKDPTFLNEDTNKSKSRERVLDTTDPTFLDADTNKSKSRERELDTTDPTFLDAKSKLKRRERELDTKDPTFLDANNKSKRRERELDTTDPTLSETDSNNKQPGTRKAKNIFIIKPKRGINVSAIHSDLGVEKQAQKDMRMKHLLRVWRNESNEQRETLQSRGEQATIVSRALQEKAFIVPRSGATGQREHPGEIDSFQGDLGANNTVRSGLKQGSLDYSEPRGNSSISHIRDADNSFPVTKSRRDIISILLSKLRRISPPGKVDVPVKKKSIRRRKSLPPPKKKKDSPVINLKDTNKPDLSPDTANNGVSTHQPRNRSPDLSPDTANNGVSTHQPRTRSIGAYQGYLKSKQLTESSLLSSRSQSVLGRQTPTNGKGLEVSSSSQRRTPKPPGQSKGRWPTSSENTSGSRPQSYKAFLLQPKKASEIDERPACYRFDKNKESSDGIVRDPFRTYSTIGTRKGQTAPTSHGEAETEERELDDSGEKMKYGLPNDIGDDQGAGISNVGEERKRVSEKPTSSQKDYYDHPVVEKTVMERPQKERLYPYRRDSERLTSPQKSYRYTQEKKQTKKAAPRATGKLLQAYFGSAPLSDNPAKLPVKQKRPSPTVDPPGMYEDFLQSNQYQFFNCSHSICAESDPAWGQDDYHSGPIRSLEQGEGEDQRVSSRANDGSRTIVVDCPDRGMVINTRRRDKERKGRRKKEEVRDTARRRREEEGNKRKQEAEEEEEKENKQEEKEEEEEEEKENTQEEKGEEEEEEKENKQKEEEKQEEEEEEEEDADMKASLADVLSIMEDSVKGESKIKLWRSDKDLEKEQRTRDLIYRLLYPSNDEEGVQGRDREDEEGDKDTAMLVLGEDEEEEGKEEDDDDNDDGDNSDGGDVSYSSDENLEDRGQAKFVTVHVNVRQNDDDSDDDNDDDNADDSDDDDDYDDDDDNDDDDNDDDDDDDVKDKEMMTYLNTPDVCNLCSTDETSVWKQHHYNEDDDDTLRGTGDSDDDLDYNEDDDNNSEHYEENEEEENDDNDKEEDDDCDSAEVQTIITSWDYEKEEEEEDKESGDEESDKEEGEQEEEDKESGEEESDSKEEGEQEEEEGEGERGEDEEQHENGDDDTENNVEEYSDSTGSKTSENNENENDKNENND